MLTEKLNIFKRSGAEEPAITPAEDNIEIHNLPKDTEAGQDVEKPELEVPTETAQEGVRHIEAITIAWDKKSLIVVYFCLWGCYFVNAFQGSLTSNLGVYVVSGFEEQSLITTIGIVASVMSAACTMPIAKMLNLWDRSWGFLCMAVLSILGLILTATCTNIYIYCASQIFYTVGFTGLLYSVDVMTADTSKMTHRGIAFAYTSTPYIITSFAGAKLSEEFYESNWRWAYGIWCIILPFVVVPLFFTMQVNLKKAKNAGLLLKEPSGRTWTQSIIHYLIEFDIAGVILLAGGLVLFLLPFTLANSAANEWRSPHIIAMLVVGFVMLVAFAIVERFIAPKPFVPFELMTSRTVIGACALDFTYQISYYCFASYFTSYCQVVYNLSISEAGYIGSIFDCVSALWLIGAGFLMRKTDRFKWLLQVSVPLYILFLGLLIYFRRPGTGIGYIVMCEILTALAGGSFIVVEQVAVMAASSHNDVAAVLALLELFGSIGDAVGNSISGAIWTNTLPSALQKYLPESALADWEDIYNDLDTQLSYPVGSDVRIAIQQAYADAQTRMLIAGTAVMALSFIWVQMMKNIRLSENKQTKGLLF